MARNKFKVDNHTFATAGVKMYDDADIAPWREFRFTVDTTKAGGLAKSFALPLISSGAYNMDVVWGDGSRDTITAYNAPAATHTYAADGVYTVKIYGQCWGWRFNNAGDKLRIINIQQWGHRFRLGTDEGGYFYGCANLNISAVDSPDMAGVTSLAHAFRGCAALNADLSELDVSGVMSMNNTFYDCTIFNQDLSGWDVSSVTNFNGLFYGCTAFNKNIGNWNTGNVTTMAQMFASATAFNQDISKWDVRKVTTFSSMFAGAVAYNNGANTNVNPVTGRAGIDGWSIGTDATVTAVSFDWMFANKTFNRPLGNWTTGKVTTMAQMFASATAFNQDISKWDVRKVTTFSSMFAGAVAYNNGANTNVNPITGRTGIDGWSIGTDATVTAVSFDWMFANKTFNRPLGNWTTGKVTTMAQMFASATAFNQDISKWDVRKVTTFSSMFAGAVAYNNGANTNVNPITGRTGIDGWSIGTDATVTAVSFDWMFANKTFNRPLGSWTTGKVTNMASMFGGSGGAGWFNQDISGWDTSNVTTMEGMFYQSVFNQPIGNWNVGKVATFSTMFYQSSFNQSLAGWNIGANTSSVNMFYMFGYGAIKQNFGMWNMTKVSSVSLMFYPSGDINETGTTTNYDNTLIGWAAQNVPTNLVFHGGASQYSEAALDAKAILLSKGWSITDGGSYAVVVWKGTTSADWNTAANWAPPAAGVAARVPLSTDSVYFMPAYNNPCTINANAVARQIEIGSGYTNTITQGAFTVTVGAGGWQQHSGTFNGSSGGMTLDGNFLLSGGTFNAGSQTITIGPYTRTLSGGTFNAESGTVQFAYGSSQASASLSGNFVFNNLTFYNNTTGTAIHTTDLSGSTLTVNGTLLFDRRDGGSGQFTVNNGTITAKGNISIPDSSGNGVGGTASLLVNGTGDQTLSSNGADLLALNINKPSGTLTLSGSIGTYNNWIYTAGTVDAGSSTVIFSGSDATAQTVSGAIALNNVTFYNSAPGTGTHTVTLDNTLTVAGLTKFDCSGSGAIQINGGTLAAQGNVQVADTNTYDGTTPLHLTGTAAQSITYSGGSGTFRLNTTINKASGTVSLASNLSLNATGQVLAVTNGTLNMAGYNLTASTLTLGASGTLKLQGGETVTTPTSNSGTVEYTGTTATVKAWSYTNLTINKPGGTYSFTGGSTYNVSGTLTLAGATGNLLTLQSTDANAWNINPSGSRTVDYVSVSKSNNTNATAIAATNSTDGGGNTNWTF